MRARWNGDDPNTDLVMYTADCGWVYMGWVEAVKPDGFCVFCCWLKTGDYPEGKIFDTAKQARKALKSAATVAIIGGFRGFNA